MTKRDFFTTTAFAALLAAVGAPGAALAQSATAVQTAAAASPGAGDVRVGEVIVTAQKRQQRIQDVPIPVTVLATDSLADTGQTRIRDYYELVPGLAGTPAQFDKASLSIRGVSPLGGAPTVGVVIDDIPVGLTGGQQSNKIPELDPGDLTRIEVLRGPQGTLYGAGSMGGLLKFVTRSPDFSGVSGRLQAGTSAVRNGSSLGFNLRGSVNVPVTEALAVRASAFVRDDPGYIDAPVLGIDGINRSQAFGARLSALWRLSDRTTANFTALYQDNRRDGLDEETRETPGFAKTAGMGALEQNYIGGTGDDRSTTQFYTLSFEAEFAGVKLASLTGYNQFVSKWSVDFGNLPLYTPAFVGARFPGQQVVGTPYFEIDKQRKFSQEVRLSTSISTFADVRVGGFYTREENYCCGFEAYAQGPDGRLVGLFWKNVGDYELKESAIFGDVTLYFTSWASLQLGARKSYFDQFRGSTTQTGALIGPTPAVAAPLSGKSDTFTYLVTPQIKLSERLMIYGRFASGFRPGNPNLTLFGIPPQSDPDTTKNYEVGLKAEIPQLAMTIDASLYHIDWRDIQLSLREPTTQFVYLGNAGAAKIDGFEMSVGFVPAEGFTLDGTFSYSDARLSEDFPPGNFFGLKGDRLPFTSKYAGSLSVRHDFATSYGDAFWGATLAYVGSRKGVFIATPARQHLPSYVKINLEAGLEVENWTVSIYANNITDERGVLNGGAGYFYTPARIYITPRTLGVNVVRTF